MQERIERVAEARDALSEAEEVHMRAHEAARAAAERLAKAEDEVQAQLDREITRVRYGKHLERGREPTPEEA